MSPLPVRVDTNANRLPSGEYSGFDSVAGCDTSRCASPPAAGTVQMSPPDENAISEPSGESDGSVKYGCDVVWAEPPAQNVAIRMKAASAKRDRLWLMNDSLIVRCLFVNSNTANCRRHTTTFCSTDSSALHDLKRDARCRPISVIV